jgi:hypothetical protein
MINTLAITVILTCSATIAYGLSELQDRYKERKKSRKEAQKAVWRQKYDKQIAKRRVVRENREQIWRMIK